ncbi:MAG: circularly permuted type 2 ATP-grasp protein [Actinomycetota bacterium]|nr:circularly permuted type 2 ATP-grasp protein [Actinomycetota bacterium]
MTTATRDHFAYDRLDGVADELVGSDGVAQPVWDPVVANLRSLGEGGLRTRTDRLGRLLRDQGATYNVYGHPAGERRPWTLDPVPHVVARDEWERLAAGVVQRARLLEQVADDLFGERRLVADGLIAADAVVGDPAFLWPCVGLDPGPRRLVLYAVDLVRHRDGSFRVLHDRVQAPSGLGYALANRQAITRVFPDMFRRVGVERLADWFGALRSSLMAMAPDGIAEPRVVILTPGPHNETYFEHAFLARTLGYSMVEGADLTVRDGRVWLKSVGGLEPVDVIWRRVDDAWCDPLELRGDSLLGVAGLLDAMRRGNVTVVNPLGSGLLESPAITSALHRVSRHLLGDELSIAANPSWWCGDPAHRAHVLRNLDRLVLRTTGGPPVFGRLLSDRARNELVQRIERRPHRWTGQAEIDLGTAPSLVDGRLQPRRAVLRLFAVATVDRDGAADGWQVLPGGMTRVADTSDAVSMAFGTADAKDVWVPSPAAGRQQPGPAPSPVQVDLRASLTARSAETLLWLGRNAERAETMSRWVSAVANRIDDDPEPTGADRAGTAALVDLVRSLAELHRVPGEGPIADRGADPEAVLLGALTDRELSGSLATSLDHLVAGSASVRELVSSGTWRVLEGLRDARADLGGSGTGLDGALDDADACQTLLAALSGLVNESMVRDPGWRFLDTGRRLERAQLMLITLSATLTDDVMASGPTLDTLLAASECLSVYRRRHRTDVEPVMLCRLLVTDPDNPRSVRFQLDRLSEDLALLPPNEQGRRSGTRDLSTALALCSDVDPHALVTRRDVMLAFAERTLGLLDAIADGLLLDHFAQVGPATLTVGGAPAPESLDETAPP